MDFRLEHWRCALVNRGGSITLVRGRRVDGATGARIAAQGVQVRHRPTSHEKVRSSVHDGPPNWTESRTFSLRFRLDV